MSDGIPAFMARRRRSGSKRLLNLNRQFDRERVYGFWDAVPDPRRLHIRVAIAGDGFATS